MCDFAVKLTLIRPEICPQYLPLGSQGESFVLPDRSRILVADEPVELTPVAATIARVAARLFAERGFDATSVREIAEAAGVTKPTLYYHFGSKQGIGEAILTRPMARMTHHLGALAMHDPGASDPAKLIEAIFQLNIDFVVDDPDRSRFVYAVCFGPVGSGFREEVHRFGEAFDRALHVAAARLADAGIIGRERVAQCVQVCRGLIMSATLDHIFSCQPMDVGLASRLVQDLLNGFARSPEPGDRRESRR